MKRFDCLSTKRFSCHARGGIVFPLLFLCGLVALTLCVWKSVEGNRRYLIPAAYLALSGVSVACYARDKRAAERGAWRIPEMTLHLLEALGGWPGALLAQRWFRHKNRKLSYQFLFWLIIAAHAGGWGYWWWRNHR
jgi:uncharacterized membrane protein YsdA (DUF1294 family)